MGIALTVTFPKGANETLGTTTVRAIPMCQGTLIIWIVSPTTFMLQLGSQVWKVWWLKVLWEGSPETS